jgi:hypothetical protein
VQAVLQTESGYTVETAPVLYKMLNHANALHWLVDNGDLGVDAIMAQASMRRRSWSAVRAGMMADCRRHAVEDCQQFSAIALMIIQVVQRILLDLPDFVATLEFLP